MLGCINKNGRTPLFGQHLNPALSTGQNYKHMLEKHRTSNNLTVNTKATSTKTQTNNRSQAAAKEQEQRNNTKQQTTRGILPQHIACHINMQGAKESFHAK